MQESTRVVDALGASAFEYIANIKTQHASSAPRRRTRRP
jgi:hypothetical protein